MGVIDWAIFVHDTYPVRDFNRKHPAILAAFRHLFKFSYSVTPSLVAAHPHGVAPGTALLIVGELIRAAKVNPRLVHLIRSLFRSAKVVCETDAKGRVLNHVGAQLIFNQFAAPKGHPDPDAFCENLKDDYALSGERIVVRSLLRAIRESLTENELEQFGDWLIRGCTFEETFLDFALADWYGETRSLAMYARVAPEKIYWWQASVGEILGKSDLQRRGVWLEKLGDAG